MVIQSQPSHGQTQVNFTLHFNSFKHYFAAVTGL
jgi:hypothetical protein